MYLAIVYIVVPFVLLYYMLKLFMEPEDAFHYTMAAVGAVLLFILTAAVCFLMAALFEEASYFKQMKLNFELATRYEDFIQDKKTLGWLLVYPYIAALDAAVVIIQLLFNHFRWYFIIPFSMTAYIVRVWLIINPPFNRKPYTEEELEHYNNLRNVEDRRDAENRRFEDDVALDDKIREIRRRRR